MHVPGESLAGVHGVRELIGWFNGEPGRPPLPLHARHVLVLGQGNVALDAARLLLLPPASLVQTDLPPPVQAALAASQVESVRLVGRRGALQLAATTSELRDLSQLPLQLRLGEGFAQRTEADATELKERPVARKLKLLEELQRAPPRPGRLLQLDFLLGLLALEGDERGHVRSALLQPQRLEGPPHAQRAVPAPLPPLRVPAELVLFSLGYAPERADPGLPWDATLQRPPHVQGRVQPGLYVVGWLKRGPQGIIGTNLLDAEETVRALLHDWAHGHLTPPALPASLPALLQRRGLQTVDWTGWKRIEAEETRRGGKRGVVREKITEVEEMLRIARGEE